MSCCGSHNNQKENKKEIESFEKPPKSIIGRYLYKLGKEDFEKEKYAGGKGGCCGKK